MTVRLLFPEHDQNLMGPSVWMFGLLRARLWRTECFLNAPPCRALQLSAVVRFGYETVFGSRVWQQFESSGSMLLNQLCLSSAQLTKELMVRR